MHAMLLSCIVGNDRCAHLCWPVSCPCLPCVLLSKISRKSDKFRFNCAAPAVTPLYHILSMTHSSNGASGWISTKLCQEMQWERKAVHVNTVRASPGTPCVVQGPLPDQLGHLWHALPSLPVQPQASLSDAGFCLIIKGCRVHYETGTLACTLPMLWWDGNSVPWWNAT